MLRSRLLDILCRLDAKHGNDLMEIEKEEMNGEQVLEEIKAAAAATGFVETFSATIGEENPESYHIMYWIGEYSIDIQYHPDMDPHPVYNAQGNGGIGEVQFTDAEIEVVFRNLMEILNRNDAVLVSVIEWRSRVGVRAKGA